MLAVTSIGDIRKNSLPELAEIREYFLDPERRNWHEGSLRIYGAEGTADQPFADGRLDIWLGIISDCSLGCYLTHSRVGVPSNAKFHSLQTPEVIVTGDMVEIGDNGCMVSKAFFVSPGAAWEAVKYFIESQGGRSGAVHWINGDQLPAGAIVHQE